MHLPVYNCLYYTCWCPVLVTSLNGRTTACTTLNIIAPINYIIVIYLDFQEFLHIYIVYEWNLKKRFKYIGHCIQILLDISIDKYKCSSFIVNCFNFQNTCTISFPANHKTNGKYAVAVSVEDFPKSTIHIGSHVYTPNNKLSTVNLQVIYS